MLHQLLDRSEDLKRLRDEGFEMEVKGGYLIIHHVPYVNNAGEIKYGSLISELTLSHNSQTTKPSTHVMHFAGGHPCNRDGTQISAIRHGSQRQNFGEGIVVDHSFSNKPANGYANYYDKFIRYIEIISAPAISIDPTVKACTFKPIADAANESVFQYWDTNSSRAKIGLLNAKFKYQKIAIVGLGGTGSYIADQIAKTHVAEIHLFDGDDFHQHNAFRSPGAASNEDLEKCYKKADYFKMKYSNMHKHITSHPFYLNEVNLHLLKGMSYVFLAVDDDRARKMIMQYLLKEGITCIDVGLGVNMVNDFLIGTMRVTVATAEKNDHLATRVSFGGENDYQDNIQMADLNAMNAILAVQKWKKLSGFYQDLEQEYHLTYTINVSQLTSEEFKEDEKARA